MSNTTYHPLVSRKYNGVLKYLTLKLEVNDRNEDYYNSLRVCISLSRPVESLEMFHILLHELGHYHCKHIPYFKYNNALWQNIIRDETEAWEWADKVIAEFPEFQDGYIETKRLFLEEYTKLYLIKGGKFKDLSSKTQKYLKMVADAIPLSVGSVTT